MTRTRTVVLMALMWLFCVCAGCSYEVRVPAAKDVAMLELSAADEPQAAWTIEDRATIERFIDFVAKRRHRWTSVGYFNYPHPEYFVNVYSGDKDVVLIWLGYSRMGGRESGGASSPPRMQKLSEAEFAEVTEILGLPKNWREEMRRARSEERYSRPRGTLTENAPAATEPHN